MRQPEEETNPDDAAFDGKGLEPLLQRCEAKLENFCKGTLLILSSLQRCCHCQCKVVLLSHPIINYYKQILIIFKVILTRFSLLLDLVRVFN